jgi:ATP-dependent DNA helicase RecG
VAIETIEIDSDEVARILTFEEGHFGDLKAVEISPAKLTRTLSAFANAEGGDLYIGVDEDKAKRVRTWRGFEDPEAANNHIQVFAETIGLDEFFELQFLRRADEPGSGLVLKASIQRTPDVRKASNGVIYERLSAQNVPLTAPEAIQRLEYGKGVRSFETHPLDVPLESVTNSEGIISFMIEVVPTGEPEPWLRKQLLIRDDKPTVAAVLLFSDEPQAALPKQSTVKLYRYATTDPEGSRKNLMGQPETIEGNVYDVIQQTVKKTVDLVEAISVMTPSGLVPARYPRVTLHEIITNAVIHRDYSVADDIHVRVFDNRIEIDSPGPFPAHVNATNVLTTRFSRNGNLVRWINKFPDPPNKDVGEGLRTAFDAMKSHKLKPPVITASPTAVRVTIGHDQLASPEEMIIEYLKNNEEVANAQVRALTGIGSENEVKRIFQRMIRGGELERIPDRAQSQAAYRLPEPKKRPAKT